ncbi:class I SAM-dependent methyltransferase [Micromonospora humi]|uniref:Methyltransferase domain-containing protein n=1 Tax=Micromonospora humi TaxID=745366 RepID=A0A1C5K7L5_9ACTN|nr:class I SAM-dependent methyltransferase [Micromonospora humi]SCG78690.1 Methyltransferase domain-containing protein [Micromonospora humi]
MSPRTLARAVHNAVRRPARTTQMLLDRRSWAGIAWFLRDGRSRQSADDERPITSRSYRSYDAYVAHQRSKLALLDLSEYDRTFRVALADRLAEESWSGLSVLCLAARLGTEVKAFHDVGAFAVGIDLNPGDENPWVLPGDFHRLVFPDRCVDAAYCNALDHALDLDRTVDEIRRVLKPGGRLVVEAQQGTADVAFDAWAATAWNRIDDLVKAVESRGLTLLRRRGITEPWAGEQLVFVTPV